MKISIIIPVFNEIKTLPLILKKVKVVNLGKMKKEIIVIDDFSNDGSREYLKNLKDKSLVKIFNKKNMGKGAAVRSGITASTGDLVIIQDADLEYDPNEYAKLIKPLIEENLDVVYGSRFLGKHNPGYRLYYWGNIFLSFMVRVLYDTKMTDMETCYKLFRKGVIKNLDLTANRYDIEPEITSKVLKGGYKIKEVPIHYKSRSFDEGKKISWKDGIKAVYVLFYWKFRNA